MSIEKRLISLAMTLILAMSMLTYSITPVFAEKANEPPAKEEEQTNEPEEPDTDEKAETPDQDDDKESGEDKSDEKKSEEEDQQDNGDLPEDNAGGESEGTIDVPQGGVYEAEAAMLSAAASPKYNSGLTKQEVLSSVQLILTPPKAATETTTPPSFTMPLDAEYSIESDKWVKNAGGEDYPESVYFVEGNTYYVKAVLTAKNGNSFDNNTQVSVTGEKNAVVSKSIGADGKMTVILSTVAAPKESTIIENVPIQIKAPDPGDTVGSASYVSSGTVTLASGVPYNFYPPEFVDKFSWKEDLDGPYLDKNAKFEASKEYYLLFTLCTTDSTQDFDPDNTSVTVNGNGSLDHYTVGYIQDRTTLSLVIKVPVTGPITNCSLNIGVIGPGSSNHVTVYEENGGRTINQYNNVRSGKYYFAPGNEIEVIEALSDGKFAGWFEGIVGSEGEIIGYKGQPFSDGNSIKYNAADGDHRNICVLFVNSDANRYNVTYDPGEGSAGPVPMSDSYAYAGTYFTLPDNGFTAPKNKVFDEWKVQIGENTYERQPGQTIPGNAITGNITVTALWRTQNVNVNYSAGEGTGGTVSIGTLDSGSTHTVKKFTDFEGFTAPEGAYFAGWIVSADGSKITKEQIDSGYDLTIPVVGDEVNADLYLTAYYAKPEPDPVDPGDKDKDKGGSGTDRKSSDKSKKTSDNSSSASSKSSAAGKKSSSPATGDEARMLIWLMVLCTAGLALSDRTIRRMNKN